MSEVVTLTGTRAPGARPRPSGRLRRRRTITALVATAPFIVFCLALVGGPLAQVVRMSLSHIRLPATGFEFSWGGLANYRDVVSDPLTWAAIRHTAVFVAVTVPGSLLVGLVMALLVYRSVIMVKLARNVMIWPAVIAPVVVSLMWLLILSPTVGGLNRVLETLGLPTQAWLNSGPGAMASLVVVDLWHWSPVVFLVVYTALQAIDADLLDAAKVDGATGWQELRHIILPLLAPAIAAVAVVRVIMGVKVFDEMYLLTSGGPNGATTLISQRVQLWFFQDLKFGPAAAFSILVVVLTAAVLGIAIGIRTWAGRRA